MARARGANALKAFAFESVYGTPPGSGFYNVPFVSCNLGEEQALIKSDLLGEGRDPQDPIYDVRNNTGSIVVPLDLRNFGFWLKALFGSPVTTQGTAARGSWTFDDLPEDGSTITFDGADWTFVASGAAGDQSLIGATLYDTLAAAVQGLNSSATAALAAATYSLNLDGKTIDVVYDTIGTGGNSKTLDASDSGDAADSNATVSGATLSGGATTGPYNHVFKSGSLTLPSFCNENGFPDVPKYAMHYGIGADKLAIQLQRSGLLNATIDVIAQGEAANTDSSAAGTPSSLDVSRFSQFTGRVTRLGVPLGDLVSGNFSYANGLDKLEVIREDGRIGGWDAGMAEAMGQAVLRFKDTVLRDIASDGSPIDLTYGWKIADGEELSFVFPRVFLPKTKIPVSGPAGLQTTYDWQAAKDSNANCAVIVTLVNDVSGY